MLTSVFVLGCTIAGAYASNQFLAKSLGSNVSDIVFCFSRWLVRFADGPSTR